MALQATRTPRIIVGPPLASGLRRSIYDGSTGGANAASRVGPPLAAGLGRPEVNAYEGHPLRLACGGLKLTPMRATPCGWPECGDGVWVAPACWSGWPECGDGVCGAPACWSGWPVVVGRWPAVRARLLLQQNFQIGLQLRRGEGIAEEDLLFALPVDDIETRRVIDGVGAGDGGVHAVGRPDGRELLLRPRQVVPGIKHVVGVGEVED